ncbi:metallophosphoesterase family protein [Rhodovulum sp. YNF3179]|uniref:metallophosphoesterase family protein n=1 Tax=Rhodovulum sp. YNF3179 TaxID=3425127 RepID=UPI003D3495D6
MLRSLLAALFTLAAGSAPAEPLRVVVISDLNGSYGSVDYAPRVGRAVSAIVALAPDLVISTGDMVAGQRRPHLPEKTIRAMWDAFHAEVSDPLAAAGIPLVVTPGNHDASAYPGFAHERRIFAEEWTARRPNLDFTGAGDWPFHYAFDLGAARFASLDATTVGALDSAQQDWLATSMDGAGPARIVFSHLPIWPFTEGRETDVIGDPALQDQFAALEIDIHLSGHHHGFYPGVIDGLGVISQACLGSGARRLLGDDRRSPAAITVLDISADGEIAVSARTGPRFADPLDLRALPERLRTSGPVIERLDIAPLPDAHWRRADGN